MKITYRTRSRKFRETIHNYYPKLSNNDSYWLFFDYLAFPTFRDELTGNPIISAELLSSIEGKTKQWQAKNYAGETFLKAFSENIQYFEWSKWDSGTQKQGKRKLKTLARIVTKLEWPVAIERIIGEERAKPKEKDRVYIHDGSAFNKQRQKIYREDAREDALKMLVHAKCPEAKALLEYMNNVRYHPFNTVLLDNYHEAIKAANLLGNNQHQQIDILNAAYDQAQPYYVPTNGSTRIYALHENITYLSKTVRHALTNGWIECDLKNAQLAIAAKIWDMPKVHEFLKQGKSIWEYLFSLYSLKLEGWEKDKQKKIFKECLYAMMFGASKKTITEKLQPFDPKLFFSDVMIKEIWKARNDQLQKIHALKGATDCFGRYIALSEYDETSILAQLTQAYELKLLYPVIKLAMENTGKSGFTITLWQHDGFSFIGNNGDRYRETWKWRLTEEVATQAKKLGINTQLEIQDIGTKNVRINDNYVETVTTPSYTITDHSNFPFEKSLIEA